MDIIINKDVGYCGVFDGDRRLVIKENGDCLMMSQYGEWRLLSSSEADIRLNRLNVNKEESAQEVKKSKQMDQRNHKSVDRNRGMLRHDTIKLNDKNVFIRKVDNHNIRG